MMKSIQAYFPSEDKAEIAKSLMVRYNTDAIEVSKLGNTEEEKETSVPLVTGGYPLVGVAQTGLGGVLSGGLQGGVLASQDVIDQSGEQNRVTYVLSTKVDEDDYDAVIDIIKNNQGEL